MQWTTVLLRVLASSYRLATTLYRNPLCMLVDTIDGHEEVWPRRFTSPIVPAWLLTVSISLHRSRRAHIQFLTTDTVSLIHRCPRTIHCSIHGSTQDAMAFGAIGYCRKYRDGIVIPYRIPTSVVVVSFFQKRFVYGAPTTFRFDLWCLGRYN